MPPNPTCKDTEALGTMKDGSGNNQLVCVPKGSGANDVVTMTRITKAQTDITNLQTMVTQVQSGGGTRSRYVGPTFSTAKVNGEVFYGTLAGIRATNQLCEKDYGAGSHVCTPFEIYESVIVGDKLDNTADIAPLMIFMEAWVPPFATGATEPYAGSSENCGGFTYKTGDRKWHNATFSYSVPTGGGTIRVPKFDASVPCGSTFFLACCK